MTFRRVVLESPFAGRGPKGVPGLRWLTWAWRMADQIGNVWYARECMADCLRRGEAPIASHLLYTQPGVLDDSVPEERARGIAAGLEWARWADAQVFYVDRGWSHGMLAARAWADEHGIPIEIRRLGDP